MKHPLIIGAGGVASYMLPVLLKTFRPEKLTIIDKDILEERNLDRQMFSEHYIGWNKGDALMQTVDPEETFDITVIQDWFTDSTDLPEGIDAIFCCADNHMARHEAIRRTHALQCYAYIGGNEYLDSQAFVYHPAWKGGPRDILRRYPNIQWDETGSPTSCQGEAQVASPQLAVANLNCAAKLLHLAWVYERWVPENANALPPSEREAIINLMPTELFTSLNDNTITF